MKETSIFISLSSPSLSTLHSQYNFFTVNVEKCNYQELLTMYVADQNNICHEKKQQLLTQEAKHVLLSQSVNDDFPVRVSLSTAMEKTSYLICQLLCF